MTGWRYLICHKEPNSYGSMITRRGTMARAKKALVELRKTISTRIDIWDNTESKWLNE